MQKYKAVWFKSMFDSADLFLHCFRVTPGAKGHQDLKEDKASRSVNTLGFSQSANQSFTHSTNFFQSIDLSNKFDMETKLHVLSTLIMSQCFVHCLFC